MAFEADVPRAVPKAALQGLEDLYRDQCAAMVRLGHLLTGSNVVAEDLVQDAFVARSPRLRSRVWRTCTATSAQRWSGWVIC
jgi:DNA-directed RNA polymerase specialized sigma24 family protein